MGEWVDLPLANARAIQAWACAPTGAARGGVVVVQEIFGVNAHIRAVAERLADAGYRTLAPAFFDCIEPGVELDYDAPGIARGRELAAGLAMDAVLEIVAAAAERLCAAGAVGVIGFCWGGTVSFVAGARLGLPAVSFYGSRNVQFLGEAAHAPQQFHFGERDASIPPAVVEQHRQAYPQAEVHVYPAGHGFNCELRADYEPESAALARARALDFLARHLA